MKDRLTICRSWFKKAKAEADPFDRFIALWLAFNTVYGMYYKESERAAIKDFVDAKMRDDNQRNFSGILNKPVVAVFKERPIRNLTRNSDTLKSTVALQNDRIPARERLKELLLILYVIRCNLFHGDKTYDASHNVAILTPAADILESLLSIYLG